jgi:hypothetical protein
VTAFLPLAQADWGTVPDWLAAVGTLLAFAVALRLLFKELDARRENEEDRRREQASRVAAWARPVGAGPNDHAMMLRNNSEQPVTAVRLVMEHPDMPEVVTREESWDLVPPGEQRVDDMWVTGPPGPVTLTFTDAAGHRWTRRPDGRLVEPDRPRRRSRKG